MGNVLVCCCRCNVLVALLGCAQMPGIAEAEEHIKSLRQDIINIDYAEQGESETITMPSCVVKKDVLKFNDKSIKIRGPGKTEIWMQRHYTAMDLKRFCERTFGILPCAFVGECIGLSPHR